MCHADKQCCGRGATQVCRSTSLFATQFEQSVVWNAVECASRMYTTDCLHGLHGLPLRLCADALCDAQWCVRMLIMLPQDTHTKHSTRPCGRATLSATQRSLQNIRQTTQIYKVLRMCAAHMQVGLNIHCHAGCHICQVYISHTITRPRGRDCRRTSNEKRCI